MNTMKQEMVAGNASENMNRKKNGPSKLGRKGDPRMHRAVAARLANPDLSLLEALRIGGFEFPADGGDDAALLDADRVTLGQRKNQLSRRLRLAKNSHSENDHGSPKSRKRTKSSGSSTSETELLQQNLVAGNKMLKRGSSVISILDNEGEDPSSAVAGDDADMQEEMASAPNRIAKFHPNYHPLFVPQPRAATAVAATPWSAASSQQAAQQQQAQQAMATWGRQQQAQVQQQQAQQQVPMNAAALATATPLNFAQLQAVTQSQQHQQPSGVAIASLNATASTVGMTLEQLAVALSSSYNLAKVLNNQTESKEELALNLYRSENLALYKRCMLMAGYDARDTNENSPACVQFVLKAWQAEGKRLEQLHSSAAELNTNLGKDDSQANSERQHQHEHHSHGHSHNDTNEGCFDGRHVHRLEGKCGHKAIIHQPDDGPAHVDFVIDGKVECYQGIKPVGTKGAFWRSKFKCDQIACNEKRPHTVTCGPEQCENECKTVKKVDPKVLHMCDIDLDGKEWNSDLFNTSNSGQIDETLLGMIRLGDNSD